MFIKLVDIKRFLLCSLLSCLLSMFCVRLNAQTDKKYIRKGNNEYEKNNYPESEVSYRKAIDKNIQSPDAVFNTGNALYKQNKYETTTARAVGEIVEVDAFIPGCPIDTGEFVRVVKNLVLGKKPDIPDYPVCVECKRNENVCVYEKGISCLGPVTRAGCDARCPSNGGYCFGCRGLIPEPNIKSQQDIMQKYKLTFEKMQDKFKLFLERNKEVFPDGK